MAFIQELPKSLQVKAQQYNPQFTKHTLQQLGSFAEGKHEHVKALQGLQPTQPKTYLEKPSSRTGLKASVVAVSESSSQAGGRLEGLRGSVTPSKPRAPGGGSARIEYGRPACPARRTTSLQPVRRCPRISRTCYPAKASSSPRQSAGQIDRSSPPPLDGGTRRRCTPSGSRSSRASRRA